MRRTITGAALCCLVSALVTGCSGSPRVTYYSLETATKTGITKTANKEMPVISVYTTTFPELVDRPQIVERLDSNRIEILEFHRWAEPLKSAVPRILADNLSRLLESDRVFSYPQNAGSDADYRVFVDFQRFESEGNAVSVEALWKINRTTNGGQKSGRVRIREVTGGEGFEAVIAAYNRALTSLSSDIAQALRAEFNSAAGQK